MNMATATLKLGNPFSKLGLKRRPTYDEIKNLIHENETITGKLPDKTATFHKASPEGSFFDGSDHFEILKEQQTRILEREMPGILLTQNARVNGRTFNLDRIREQRNLTPPTETTRSSDENSTHSAQIQTELQERARRELARQQRAGEAHSEETTRQARLPAIESFLEGVTTPIRRMIQPLPIPARQVEQVDLTRGEDMRAEEE